MYKDFQSEKVLLTEEMKKKREDDIMKKEKQEITLCNSCGQSMFEVQAELQYPPWLHQ